MSFEALAIKYVLACLNSRPGRTYCDDLEPEVEAQSPRGECKGKVSCPWSLKAGRPKGCVPDRLLKSKGINRDKFGSSSKCQNLGKFGTKRS